MNINNVIVMNNGIYLEARFL